MEKHRKLNYEEVGGAKTGTPCLVAAMPFFLVTCVLFYYVFTENYSFKWTLVIIFSGCAVLMPGAVLLMLGLGIITTGEEGKLDDEQKWSHRMSLKRKTSGIKITSTPPDLKWKAVSIQRNYALEDDATENQKKIPLVD